MPVASRATGRRLVPAKHEVVVAAGMVASQLSVYGLNIAASRSLGTHRFGELATLLTLTVLLSIPALATQSWTARHLATAPPGPRSRVLSVQPVPVVAAVSVLLAAAVPASAAPGLGVDPLAAAVASLSVVVPTCFLAVAQGALQGEQRFGRLAVVLAAAGAGRLVGGLAALWLGASAWQVVVGVGAGTAVGAAIGWALAGLPLPRHGGPRTLLPVLRIAAGTGGVWALANLDIVLARAALSSHDAGLYAVGALATRAVLWAPQFLTVSSFAQFTDAERSWTILLRSAEKVLALGAVAVLLCWGAGPWVVRIVFGPLYVEVGPVLWGFAALGLVLALVQLLVSQRIARHDETATYAAWGAAALAVVTVVSGWPGTVGQVVASLLVVASALAVLLVVRARLRP